MLTVISTLCCILDVLLQRCMHYSRFLSYLNNSYIIIAFLRTYEFHRLESNVRSLHHNSEGVFQTWYRRGTDPVASLELAPWGQDTVGWLTEASSESLVSCNSHYTRAEWIKAGHILIQHHSHLEYCGFEWCPYLKRRWIIGGFWANSRKMRPLFYSGRVKTCLADVI